MTRTPRPAAWTRFGLLPVGVLALLIVFGMALLERPMVLAQLAKLPPRFGDPLPGLTPAQLQRFINGRAGFEAEETDADGIGPVFNGRSCVECHAGPATGGSGIVLSVRIGRMVNGTFDPLLSLGGPTIQSQGATGLMGFQYSGEVVPQQATIVARRRSNPVFGFGLVDAVPDAAFHLEAARQLQDTPATAGRPNIVMNLKTGDMVVGKFGWKAGIATVFDFCADAYKDEMGITVPGFLTDADGRNIADENPPQGDSSLLLFNLADTNPNELEDDDVFGFADFISFLGPPPRTKASLTARRGEQLFSTIGCAACHQPTMQTGPNSVQALNLVTFHPYSDFLLHNMGALGDGIHQGIGTGPEMRTAPLWGLRKLPFFLHDGRATTVHQAIQLHDGQGLGARNQYLALPIADQQAVLAFLNTL